MKQFFKYVLATIVGMITLTIIGFIILFAMIAVSAISADKPVKAKENSVYQLDIKGQLADRYEESPLAFFDEMYGGNYQAAIGLDDILANIQKAKDNEKIKGIYLKMGYFRGGFASVKEIRDALVNFKTSGKFIVAYGDSYSQNQYYLASAADKILLNPQGMLEWQGLAGQIPFFKGTLDKLGVEMQVIRVGKFKSAVEPYTETKMSEANREQVTAYVNSLWNTMLADISEGRNISIDDLNRFADEVLFVQPAESIKNLKMIDEIVYADGVDKVINQYLQQPDSSKVNYLTHNKMRQVTADKKLEKDKIAVIYAVGEIFDGDSKGEGIYSDKMLKIIKKAANDEHVKAVVLRVNSPGGSAYASEQIWHAVSELKTKKPIVVSMGDYAASGGYYIACNADYIFAQPNTITGSIGIFGLIPNIQGLTNKIGVTFDGVKTNKHSDMISLNRPFTNEERGLMQAYINRGYELFTQRCADGRKMQIDSIKAIAEGRVWTGETAVKIGLVDEMGGLPQAISKAAELANLKTYSTKDFPAKETIQEKVLKMFSGDVKAEILKSYLGEKYQIVEKIKNIEQLNGIQARMEYDLTIE